MKRSILALAFVVLVSLPLAGFCGGDLGAFKARLATTFGVPGVQVEAVLGNVHSPGDACMVFRMGQVAGRPHDGVLAEYQANQGKGWGVIAKNMGIKPGSAEFHSLKKGWDDGSGKGKG